MLNARRAFRMGNELQVRKLNIAICDDEEAIREQIKELMEKEKPGVCPGLYETGDGLLAAGGQFDLVFLDIQMDGTDGIETAKKHCKGAKVVLNHRSTSPIRHRGGQGRLSRFPADQPCECGGGTDTIGKVEYCERNIYMNHFRRFLLLAFALVVGGGMGYKLLIGFEPIKMIIFILLILVLGEVFYQIDKRLFKEMIMGQIV